MSTIGEAALWQALGLGEKMEAAQRRSVIAHGRFTMRELRLAAAREHGHGLQIMTFEQPACRLAGGVDGTNKGESYTYP